MVRNKDLKTFFFLGAKRVSHSTEEPGVGAALGKFCKLGPSQRLDIAFLAVEKANIKVCDSEN